MEYNNFIDKITSSKHITLNGILIIIIILFICFILCFYDGAEFVNLRANYLHKQCYYNCGTEKCKDFMKSVKGVNYYNGDDKLLEDTQDETLRYEDCIVGFWELSHLVLHIFIGYFLNIYYSLALGVGFELFEYYKWNCEGYLDILFNTAGALIGIYLR
jgi:hypothetical protein